MLLQGPAHEDHSNGSNRAHHRTLSAGSLEFPDDGCDPVFYRQKAHLRKRHENYLINIPPSAVHRDQQGLFSGLWGLWNLMAVKRRMKQFDKDEAKMFIKQMSHRVDQILHDHRVELSVYDFLVGGTPDDMQSRRSAERRLELFRIKFGDDLTDWLKGLPPNCKRSSKHLRDVIAAHTNVNKVGVAMADALQHVESLKAKDALLTWCDFKTDAGCRVMSRIHEFAAFVCGMIRWSFVIEPGRPRTELSFEVVESFFDHVELHGGEMSQTAFESNYATKARNRRIVCGDYHRVVLKSSTAVGVNGNLKAHTGTARPMDVFGDFDCPEVKYHENYGTDDFIHANVVSGGPLINNFILTQAPMDSTVTDFWRMVWQEKSEYIFMLCGATDTERVALLGTGKPSNYCPYYWPRSQGGVYNIGDFVVRNDNVSMTMDPLFTVTSLSMWLNTDPSNVHRVQHWQYDWVEFSDFHWPLRILRRSRTSPTPTIVHCMDGCGRSGTLVLIEIMLMQLLRGSNHFANPMLTACVFLRLQRRNAVASNLQYLFAYRTIIHWMQPFVLSTYHRLCLGYMWRNSGFCAKFAELAASYGRQAHCNRS